MSKFLYTLSTILVVAKIFTLVTFSWGVCLLPAICAIVIKCVLYGSLLGKITEILTEIDKEDAKNDN